MSQSNRRLISVSLNQLKSLTTFEHGLVIYRRKVNKICVVGYVLHVNTSDQTRTIYKLTDYTGPTIDAVLWLSAYDEKRMKDLNQIGEQTYCRVFGQAKKDENDKVSILAFHIEPLANLNDITIHLIEVVKHAKDLKNSKDSKKVNGELDANNNLISNQQNAKSVGFTHVQTLVLNEITEDDSLEGKSLNDICSNLRSIERKVIVETIAFLILNSHIYETADDHYKSC